MSALTRDWPDPDRRDDALLRCLCDTHRHELASELTPMQRRILEAASHGLDADGIATLVGVTQESVKTHLKLARRCLRAKNTTHAVAEALRRQLIR